nr:hypothetical protein [Tanacetum cinerariifolium]
MYTTDVDVYYAPGLVLRGEVFDGAEACVEKKYGVVGTFMSVYYKCKKTRKTEKEVHEAEQAQVDFVS